MMNRRRHGCLAAVCVIIGAMVGSAARAGEIRVWPTAVVAGDVVVLADVADLRDFDLPTEQRLGKAVVHAAPRAGGQVLVRLADVRGALADAEANLAAIKVFGSSCCTVSKPRQPREARPASKRVVKKRDRSVARKQVLQTSEGKSVVVERDTLASVLRRYITARVSDPDATVEIRFSPASEHVLALDTTDHRFKIRPSSKRRLGFLSFEVDVIRDGEPLRAEPIVAEVQLVKEVVVARRPINRGRSIEGRDLKLEERRFIDQASVGITDLSAVVGKRCGRFLRRGDMLRAEVIEALPLVRRGDIVTIWARLGGVEIQTTGKARGSGALGDRIEVCRNGVKRKQDLIEAVITGPKTVTVTDPRQVASR